MSALAMLGGRLDPALSLPTIDLVPNEWLLSLSEIAAIPQSTFRAGGV